MNLWKQETSTTINIMVTKWDRTHSGDLRHTQRIHPRLQRGRASLLFVPSVSVR